MHRTPKKQDPPPNLQLTNVKSATNSQNKKISILTTDTRRSRISQNSKRTNRAVKQAESATNSLLTRDMAAASRNVTKNRLAHINAAESGRYLKDRNKTSKSLLVEDIAKSRINHLGKVVSYLSTLTKDEVPKRRRKELPSKPTKGASLWSVIKNSVGKDLASVPMPVGFSEPISMLQRLAEDFRYSALLDTAARVRDPVEQTALVAAFTVSAYSSSGCRFNKPFDSLPFETYELDRRDDLGWRLMSEQISSWPAVSAQYCEGKRWKCWKSFSVVTVFRGKYMKVTPSGASQLTFDTGRTYSWGRVASTVNNLLFGTMWIDNVGQVEVVNHTDSCLCQLTYLPYNSYDKTSYKQVKGSVVNVKGEVKLQLNGKWDDHLDVSAVSLDGDQRASTAPSYVIWKVEETPPEISVFYNFSLFACQLNEPERRVAPTDSRNRRDMRLMEEGRWEEADALKRKMDSVCSHVGKSAAARPVWFKEVFDPVTEETVYQFDNSYWKAKHDGNWSRCPDIFNVN